MQVTFDLIDLNTGVRVIAQAGNLQTVQLVTVQAIAFEMVIYRHHIRFTVHHTTKPRNRRRLKEPARLLTAHHPNHVRIPLGPKTTFDAWHSYDFNRAVCTRGNGC